jgi:hypothetical protein
VKKVILKMNVESWLRKNWVFALVLVLAVGFLGNSAGLFSVFTPSQLSAQCEASLTQPIYVGSTSEANSFASFCGTNNGIREYCNNNACSGVRDLSLLPNAAPTIAPPVSPTEAPYPTNPPQVTPYPTTTPTTSPTIAPTVAPTTQPPAQQVDFITAIGQWFLNLFKTIFGGA